MKYLVSILLTVASFTDVFAATYYFSATGNDSRSSLEARNPATPWRTITKLNSIFSTLQAGDSILFKRGEVFDGSIIIAKSGSASLPIVFSAYGSGTKPVINGFAALTTWTSLGNGIYETYSASLGSQVNILTVNNSPKEMGRFPNSTAVNKGYLTFENYNTNLSLSDNQLTSTPNWTGAEVVIRTRHWIIDRRKISNHSGNTISFTPQSTNWLKNNYGYFIQNDVRTLDQFGEWYYNPATKKMYVYFGSQTPSALQVKAGVANTLVTIHNQSYLTFDNLSFTGSNISGFDISGSQNTTIKNCDFNHHGTDAVNGSVATNLRIEGNNFKFTNNSCLNLAYNCSNAIIRNNNISNTTVFAGMLKSGNVTGMGIYISGNNNLVEYNNIDSSGFTPVRFAGNYVTVKNNFITNFHFVKDDGGAIYTWNNNADAIDNTGRKIIGNIILNGIGAHEGTEGNLSADGIYMDDNSAGVEINGNTIANCNNNGIFIHNSHNISILNNTAYNNARSQVTYKHDEIAANRLIRNMSLTGNILFAKNDKQLSSRIETILNDIALMGSFDNNFYCRPLHEQSNIFNSFVNTSGLAVKTHLDLGTWKTLYSKDAISRVTAKQIPSFKVSGINSGNKFSNGTFSSNISGIYAYSTATSYSTTWNSGGKLDGGCFQGSVSSVSPCAYSPIINIGSVSASKKYLLKFSSLATVNTEFRVYLRQANSPYNQLTEAVTFTISANRKENEFLFTVPISESYASIGFETFSQNVTFWLDNIQLMEVSATVTNPDDHIRFEYNATNTNKNISLNGNYIDPKNNRYSSSFTLLPYSSVILIADTSAIAGVPPAVAITSPVSNSNYNAPASINILASATDSDGTITKVDFYSGNTLLGTKTTSPYTFYWSSVVQGTYTLTAKATDNSGNVSTSSPVIVNVNPVLTNSLPSVAITSPSTGSSYSSPANLSISASASDVDGTISRVDFYNGTSLLATKTAAPYTFTWGSVPAGTYTLTAKATDNSGSTAVSSPVTVYVNTTVSNIPPAVSIISPATNTSYNAPASFSITASATDADGSISKVDFYNGSAFLGSRTAAPYTLAWNSVAAGIYTITARATDNRGSVTVSQGIQVNVIAPNIPPAVSISSPANNSSFEAPANIIITANASDPDGSITKVDFYNGSVFLGSKTTAPYSFAWNSVAAGSYTITAKATDNRGSVTTSAQSFIRVNAPNILPSVSIISPVTNTYFNSPANISITAVASDADGSISKVDFYNGSVLIGTKTVAPYTFNWPSIEGGTYSLYAKATDNRGSVSTSAMVKIFVRHSPNVAITSPEENTVFTSSSRISLTADASDNDGNIALVEFFSDTEYLGSTTIAPYSYTWRNIRPGSYTVTARATDNDGLTRTSIPVNFSVKTSNTKTAGKSSASGSNSEKLSGNVLISLSPVPARNYLTLVTSGLELNKEMSVTLFGSNGNRLKEIRGISNEKLMIDLQQLPAGVYLLKLQSGSFTTTEKFIKE